MSLFYCVKIKFILKKNNSNNNNYIKTNKQKKSWKVKKRSVALILVKLVKRLFAVLKEVFQHQRMSDSYISCLLLTLESVFTCLLVAHPGLFILGNKYRDCFCREVNNQFYVFFPSLKSNQSITQVAKRNLSNTAAIFIGC